MRIKSLKWAPADIPLIDELLDLSITDKNLTYYNLNADDYVKETADLDIKEIRDKFIRMLPPKAHILDLGCGSGRDSKVFLELGFSVTPIEPSEPLAKLASTLMGKPVIIRRAQDIEESNQYDAVWACASLLHISKVKMENVISRITNTLKPGGVFYTSFKEGKNERWDEKGRFFNDYEVKELSNLLTSNHNFSYLDIIKSNSILRGKSQNWLNVYAKK